MLRVASIALVVALLGIAGCGDDPLRPGGLTPSGAVYEDLEVGGGARVRNGDRVSIDYSITLENGAKVDSSYAFIFTVGAGEVIVGLEEGMVGMREGGTRRIVIPPRLAYGDQGFGEIIPPNATLNFLVMLRHIVHAGAVAGRELEAP
jgi:FKBP-type peptidyl-prolyl cis-trans isomerase FkpA